MFNYGSITDQGRELLARAVGGNKLIMTRIVCGDGVSDAVTACRSEAELKTILGSMTSLIGQKAQYTLTNCSVDGAVCELTAVANHTTAPTPFNAREGGVYAKVSGDTVEFLLAYYTAVDYLAGIKHDTSDYIYVPTGGKAEVKLSIEVGSTAEVEASIQPDARVTVTDSYDVNNRGVHTITFTDFYGDTTATIKDGVGFKEVVTAETAESSGTNTVTFKLNNGTETSVNIKNGKSAYQYAQAGGYTGTESQFNAALESFTCPYPVGSVYMQFPPTISQDGPIRVPLEPSALWPNTIWRELDYNGAFFRATGDDSEAFGTKQNEGLPNITGEIGATAVTSDNTESGAFYNIKTGKIADGTSVADNYHINRGFDASRSNAIYGNSEHVTPENYAVKIWFRTA